MQMETGQLDEINIGTPMNVENVETLRVESLKFKKSSDKLKSAFVTKNRSILLFFWVLCLFLPNMALIIPSFVIAGQNSNITCDGSMMPLSTWLYVFAGIELALTILSCISILIADDVSKIFFSSIYSSSFFMFIWNIVGAVALFRDAKECREKAEAIWNMTLAILIIQWIVMFISWCTVPKSKK